MANTTLTVAADTTVSMKVNEMVVGQGIGSKGASIKAFTATAGTGNFPVAGMTLDLSALFPNKVLAVVCSALYDTAVTTGDLAFPVIYIPSAGNVPSTGKIHAYCSNGAANAGLLHLPDDNTAVTGYVVTGFAIGY
jgi:hypothetical protein